MTCTVCSSASMSVIVTRQERSGINGWNYIVFAFEQGLASPKDSNPQPFR